MPEEIAARLARYTTVAKEHEYVYFWQGLAELACEWATFDLVFSLPPEERAPDELQAR